MLWQLPVLQPQQHQPLQAHPVQQAQQQFHQVWQRLVPLLVVGWLPAR
ncbi:hypothetical protein K5Z09_004933 [Escherichia coli]|nr:hypothetical protein [Escherichia coli]EHR9219531.1 hypothetical protein [Escherichia coli]EIM2921490.1 hypothetical protein [Escherichia coli]EIM2960171.1 hypothetical protein [Escherichia coli]